MCFRMREAHAIERRHVSSLSPETPPLMLGTECPHVRSPDAPALRMLWPTLAQWVTSRELLYHLPCESSARKLESFGSRWLASETAMRADRVVMPPPAFCHDLCLLERREQLAIAKLIPHLAMK
jgi:hypothetical protein